VVKIDPVPIPILVPARGLISIPILVLILVGGMNFSAMLGGAPTEEGNHRLVAIPKYAN